MPRRAAAGGRPSILDDTEEMTKKRKRFLDLLRVGTSVKRAAGASGLGRSTVQRVLAKGRTQRKGRERDFWDMVEGAKDEGIAHLHQAVVRGAAKNGFLALQLLQSIAPAEYNPAVMARIMAIQAGNDDEAAARSPGVRVRRETKKASA